MDNNNQNPLNPGVQPTPEPVQPIQPAQPVQPVQPLQPAQPIQPVQPVVQPVQPVQPIQPAPQPIQPAPQPVNPLQSIYPQPGAAQAAANPLQSVYPQPGASQPAVQTMTKTESKNTGKIVGIICGVLGVIAVTAILIKVLSGGNPLVGKWECVAYDTTNKKPTSTAGTLLELNGDGSYKLAYAAMPDKYYILGSKYEITETDKNADSTGYLLKFGSVTKASIYGMDFTSQIADSAVEEVNVTLDKDQKTMIMSASKTILSSSTEYCTKK